MIILLPYLLVHPFILHLLPLEHNLPVHVTAFFAFLALQHLEVGDSTIQLLRLYWRDALIEVLWPLTRLAAFKQSRQSFVSRAWTRMLSTVHMATLINGDTSKWGLQRVDCIVLRRQASTARRIGLASQWSYNWKTAILAYPGGQQTHRQSRESYRCKHSIASETNLDSAVHLIGIYIFVVVEEFWQSRKFWLHAHPKSYFECCYSHRELFEGNCGFLKFILSFFTAGMRVTIFFLFQTYFLIAESRFCVQCHFNVLRRKEWLQGPLQERMAHRNIPTS